MLLTHYLVVIFLKNIYFQCSLLKKLISVFCILDMIDPKKKTVNFAIPLTSTDLRSDELLRSEGTIARHDPKEVPLLNYVLERSSVLQSRVGKRLSRFMMKRKEILKEYQRLFSKELFGNFDMVGLNVVPPLRSLVHREDADWRIDLVDRVVPLIEVVLPRNPRPLLAILDSAADVSVINEEIAHEFRRAIVSRSTEVCGKSAVLRFKNNPRVNVTSKIRMEVRKMTRERNGFYGYRCCEFEFLGTNDDLDYAVLAHDFMGFKFATYNDFDRKIYLLDGARTDLYYEFNVRKWLRCRELISREVTDKKIRFLSKPVQNKLFNCMINGRQVIKRPIEVEEYFPNLQQVDGLQWMSNSEIPTEIRGYRYVTDNECYCYSTADEITEERLRKVEEFQRSAEDEKFM